MSAPVPGELISPRSQSSGAWVLTCEQLKALLVEASFFWDGEQAAALKAGERGELSAREGGLRTAWITWFARSRTWQGLGGGKGETPGLRPDVHLRALDLGSQPCAASPRLRVDPPQELMKERKSTRRQSPPQRPSFSPHRRSSSLPPPFVLLLPLFVSLLVYAFIFLAYDRSGSPLVHLDLVKAKSILWVTAHRASELLPFEPADRSLLQLMTNPSSLLRL